LLDDGAGCLFGNGAHFGKGLRLDRGNAGFGGGNLFRQFRLDRGAIG
jgi:hypothetical protein